MKRAVARLHSFRRFLIAAMTVVFGLFLPMRPAEDRLAGQPPCHVTLENGEVQGNNLGETCAFWGIPFAASTAASNRWKPPQSRPAWHPLVFDATTAKTTTCAASEDCLWLNVWVRNPPKIALAPVPCGCTRAPSPPDPPTFRRRSVPGSRLRQGSSSSPRTIGSARSGFSPTARCQPRTPRVRPATTACWISRPRSAGFATTSRNSAAIPTT